MISRPPRISIRQYMEAMLPCTAPYLLIRVTFSTPTGVFLFPAFCAITADFKSGDEDVELAIALDLPFDAIEQITLELLHAAASQTGHVHVIALRPPLVKVAFPFHVQ